MDLDNKFRGAMLGGAIGELAFGLDDRAALTAAVDRCPSLVYTDDTTMTIGVAEVLVAHGGLDPGHCQTNLNGPAKGASLRRSDRQLTPLGQGGGTVLFEDVPAFEVAVLVEVVMN